MGVDGSRDSLPISLRTCHCDSASRPKEITPGFSVCWYRDRNGTGTSGLHVIVLKSLTINEYFL